MPALSRLPESAGTPGGLVHLGFHTRKPKEIDKIVERAVNAGATIVTHRDFSTGRPYAKLQDLDGHHFEVDAI